jgi:hypothetical protein
MTLTGTWATNPAGTLALTWTAGQPPVRHRHKPQNISEGRHRD